MEGFHYNGYRAVIYQNDRGVPDPLDRGSFL